MHGQSSRLSSQCGADESASQPSSFSSSPRASCRCVHFALNIMKRSRSYVRCDCGRGVSRGEGARCLAQTPSALARTLPRGAHLVTPPRLVVLALTLSQGATRCHLEEQEQIARLWWEEGEWERTVRADGRADVLKLGEKRTMWGRTGIWRQFTDSLKLSARRERRCKGGDVLAAT